MRFLVAVDPCGTSKPPIRTMSKAIAFSISMSISIASVWLVLFCATITLLAQEAPEGNNASAEVQIRALERAWTVGEARNDNRALDLIFDDALVYIEYGKLMTKGEYLLRIRMADPHSQQIVMEGISVQTFGNTAIVIGIYREKDVTDRKTLLTRWRFIDTWVKKKGNWLLVAAASAPLSK